MMGSMDLISIDIVSSFVETFLFLWPTGNGVQIDVMCSFLKLQLEIDEWKCFLMLV